ncbi:Diphthamide biosynthesis protein 4 [Saxophila tyrrhenica]|uniref:Diphthamide biosynthesis protein 4 n=1 Tax=Saxophila tyrrhenica TaxID=1690608 RepID=A0AAV9PL44_9PEZI|nr:Diphthamide biosynthesis protein 4 [Saxophila tyrrhenica]
MAGQVAHAEMGNNPNYYRLLNLESKQREPLLPASEVKQAYRRALLQYHPDKNKTGAKKTGVTVDDIALAYKNLSDPALRAEYDRWLQSVAEDVDPATTPRPRHTGLETVDLDDLEYDEAFSLWTRGCRCGDAKGFSVSESELEQQADEGEIIVGCKGCSLWLRILFGVEG